MEGLVMVGTPLFGLATIGLVCVCLGLSGAGSLGLSHGTVYLMARRGMVRQGAGSRGQQSRALQPKECKQYLQYVPTAGDPQHRIVLQ